ncbi:LexA family protein [Celerinatantimonas sp. YJH-8]|uniref:LexA family protein n=1 Tax=Celerinatantimonas sp. YJH-8 TaxID=3228714 RepID=UPI0038CAE636
MKTLSERLNHALQLTEMTQSELARCIGIKQQSISQICSGKSVRSRYTMQIAETLRVNAHWLATGEGDIGLGVSNVDVGLDMKGRIPLINWVQAGDWSEIAEGFTHEDIEKWREVSGKAHEGCFALRVKGDSMENPSGKKSIPEGAVIVVDPEWPASSGSLVVARLDDSKEAIFKQLIIEGEQKYLKPLNPQYPVIPINSNCTIIGVVRQAIIDFG